MIDEHKLIRFMLDNKDLTVREAIRGYLNLLRDEQEKVCQEGIDEIRHQVRVVLERINHHH